MVWKTLDANLVIGKKYNRLTILEYIPKRRQTKGRENSKVVCLCECGNKSIAQYPAVKSGKIKSCGCYHREIITTHLMSKTAEYRAWDGMKARCSQPKRDDYVRYGGRGIKVCDRWANSFENFFKDMGAKPTKSHSLDRINNDGNYEPENCRWATVLEQNRNKTYYQQGQRTTLVCKNCKKEFSIKNCKALKSKYCSHRCRYPKLYNQLEGVS